MQQISLLAIMFFFPTDFSENAASALDYVSEMVVAGVQKVTLLHIQDKTKISPHLDDRLEEFNKIDKDRMHDTMKFLQDKANVKVGVIIKYGSPSVEIIKTAKELNIKLIVMGTQGRGFVKEFFLGSVSNNVAHQSESSVLLIPPKTKDD